MENRCLQSYPVEAIGIEEVRNLPAPVVEVNKLEEQLIRAQSENHRRYAGNNALRGPQRSGEQVVGEVDNDTSVDELGDETLPDKRVLFVCDRFVFLIDD